MRDFAIERRPHQEIGVRTSISQSVKLVRRPLTKFWKTHVSLDIDHTRSRDHLGMDVD